MEQVGRYRLAEQIGQTDVAAIYRAYEVTGGGLVKPVTLERMLPEHARRLEHDAVLVEGARIAEQLDHPNLVKILDLDQSDGVWFSVQERVEGRDLATLTAKARERGQKIDLSAALYVTMQILQGLAHAHQRTSPHGRPLEIVHRDVCPRNVLVGYGGEVRLRGFGYARIAGRADPGRPGLDQPRYRYASPEQAMGSAFDHRSDVFAVGLLLWELIAGRPAYETSDEMDALAKARRANVPPLHTVAPDLSPDVLSVLERAVAFNRDQRPASAQVFRDELARILYAKDPTYGPAQLASQVARVLADEAAEDRQKDAKARAALGGAPAGGQPGRPEIPSFPAPAGHLLDGTAEQDVRPATSTPPVGPIERAPTAVPAPSPAPVDAGRPSAPPATAPPPASPSFEPNAPPPASPSFEPNAPPPASAPFEPTAPPPASPSFEPTAPPPASAPFEPTAPPPASPSFEPNAPPSASPSFEPDSPPTFEPPAVASPPPSPPPATAVPGSPGAAGTPRADLGDRGPPVAKIAVGVAVLGLVGVAIFAFSSESNMRLVKRKAREAVVGRKPGGTLSIESMPTGALVVFDDERTGKRTPMTIENVESEVTHFVQLELEGEKPVTATVSIPAAGAQRKLSLVFSDAIVDVNVETEPASCEVYKDGRNVALTPAKMLARAGETFKLEVKKLGYEDFVQEITPERGKPINLEIEMEKTDELLAAEEAEAAAMRAVDRKKKRRRRRRRR